MTRNPWLRYLLLPGLLIPGPFASRAQPADPPRPAAGMIVVRHCTMDYERSSLLGVPNLGVLQDCLVKPGDRVEAGQVLGRLQDREIRAELEVRRAQAGSDIEVRLHEARHAQSLNKLKAAGMLKQRKFMSVIDYESQRLDADAAELAIEDAKFRRRLAELQVRQAEAAVRAREIVAPPKGVVVAVFKTQGEPINLNTPIFQVVDPDRFRVTGFLDVDDAWRVQQGQPARVIPEVGGVDLKVEHQAFAGRITFVDRLVDPTRQTCKVVAEVDDPAGRLRAGLGARMEILPAETPVAGPSGPAHSAPASP